jgi:hypothetical protein
MPYPLDKALQRFVHFVFECTSPHKRFCWSIESAFHQSHANLSAIWIEKPLLFYAWECLTPKGLPNFGAYTLGPLTMTLKLGKVPRSSRHSPIYSPSIFFSFIPRMKYNILHRSFSFSFPPKMLCGNNWGLWNV